MGRLEEKVALVTGAGSGLGRAIARLFAREGAFVFATDRDQGLAQETERLISGEGGKSAAVRADVTAPGDVAAMLAAVEGSSGHLNVLVNNAGINRRADFRDLKDSDWHELVEVNLYGVVRCSRDALPLLRAAKGASVINLSSIMGHRHVRQISAYSATKAAVAGLSRAMAVEYAPYGIRVNYLCPGYVETALTERVLRNEAIRKALLMQTPMGRFGTPEDIARAALFLASDDSAYITGSGLTVDGGMSVAL